MDWKLLLGGTFVTSMIAGFWTQLRTLGQQMAGFMFVPITFDNSVADNVDSLLRKRAGYIGGASHSWFSAMYYSSSRMQQVPVIMEKSDPLGHFIMYKRMPLWVKWITGNNNENRGNGISITYIRWTFDRIKFAEEVLDYLQAPCELKAFRVIHFRGSAMSMFSTRGSRNGLFERGSSEASAPSSVSRDEFQYQRYYEPLVGGTWEDILGRNQLALENVALSAEADKAVAVIRDWRKSREWCRERGIPWKLGVLLTGPPGNGKTAFIRGISADMGMPVYVFHLSTLTSNELGMFWEKAAQDPPIVAVFEDIDNVFEGRESKNDQLTFDDFLNCLDGVDQHSGVLAFVTTNRPETLDGALAGKGSVTRPGRIDISLVFNKPSEEGRRKIANRILRDFSKPDRELVIQAGAEDTGAQFQNRCVNTARRRIRGETNHDSAVGQNGKAAQANSSLSEEGEPAGESLAGQRR